MPWTTLPSRLLACKLEVYSHIGVEYSDIGLPWWSSSKESTHRCKRGRFDPWIRKFPWKRKWQPTPLLLLGNPMDSGAWWATVHEVTKSRTLLSDWACKIRYISLDGVVYPKLSGVTSLSILEPCKGQWTWFDSRGAAHCWAEPRCMVLSQFWKSTDAQKIALMCPLMLGLLENGRTAFSNKLVHQGSPRIELDNWKLYLNHKYQLSVPVCVCLFFPLSN